MKPLFTVLTVLFVSAALFAQTKTEKPMSGGLMSPLKILCGVLVLALAALCFHLFQRLGAAQTALREASRQSPPTPTNPPTTQELEEVRSKLATEIARVEELQAQVRMADQRLATAMAPTTPSGPSAAASGIIRVRDQISTTSPSAPEWAVLSRLDATLRDILKGDGITEFSSKGAAFDPERHQAVSTVTVSDASQANLVSESVRAGYQMNGKLLRAEEIVVTVA